MVQDTGLNETGRKSKSGSKAVEFADVVVGINVRKKDNLFQLVFIVCSVFLCILIPVVHNLLAGKHHVFDMPSILGGAFIGLIGGLLLSGFILMIYRIVKR